MLTAGRLCAARADWPPPRGATRVDETALIFLAASSPCWWFQCSHSEEYYQRLQGEVQVQEGGNKQRRDQKVDTRFPTRVQVALQIQIQ